MTKPGKLYLIPCPLGDDAIETIPAYAVDVLHRLSHLVAERAKTTRHFIKATNPPKPISEYQIEELNEHTPVAELENLLRPALEGHDLGILSEAGCPGIADPGAKLVELAHRRGVEVVPLVGPSSILLALMASGMNGQSFAFQGYLSQKALADDLKRLEQLVAKHRQTQIFIETPYRNRAVIEQAAKVLQPGTRFCIAVDLTLPTQSVQTKTIAEWRKKPLPELGKRPAIFLIS
ncbi:MAG: SAM-dependent methyltransferase [Saprospiraceae bacterium]|nr:SAM-dependent methyltransferase [Saprospiraceae bacterium]MCF8249032.1 SAM-dependent methyltransferase [Saprospiraceae bacterium]MCF8310926.1 SAM-dependent methyltransferase [Saprospiraceae bacterium]MCF8439486.1 SAM-dependent methyltransferase [Saprospiraceae bacterium]